MDRGRIVKALSGFYYVEDGDALVTCRARGRFRREGITPLVGDFVRYSLAGEQGMVEEIMPRRNAFRRPPVANIDVLVIVASAAIPVTAPLVADRLIVTAERNDCLPVICLNKWDLVADDALADTYRRAGFPVVETSAVTGLGLEKLRDLLAGKTCALTGNSGVGKSSLLNALDTRFALPTGEISEKLGRGRHTTRHVELFRLDNGAVIADTPGFSAFDGEDGGYVPPRELPLAFREFAPFLGACRFDDCAHTKEDGCAILAAVERGEIPRSRHESYCRMYEEAKAVKTWELKET